MSFLSFVFLCFVVHLFNVWSSSSASFFNIKLVTVKSSLAVCDSIVCLVTSLLAEDEFAGVKFGVALFTACVNVQACVNVLSSYGFLCVFIILFACLLLIELLAILLF